MARVVDQDIPSELQDGYDAVLGTSEWLPDTFRVKERPRFRMPELQGCRTIRPYVPRGSKVTDPMCLHRKVFGPCVRCFNKQPWSGGAEPDGIGPYSRTWWFSEAVGKLPWYFNYFMRKTIDKYVADDPPNWCKTIADDVAFTKSNSPDTVNCNTSNTFAMWKDLGRWRTHIKKQGTDVKDIWLKIMSVSWENGQDWPIILYAQEISAEWVCGSLTWNNQPALGPLLDVVYIWDTDPKWIRFVVGDAQAVAIRCVKEHWTVNFIGRGWPSAGIRPAWT